MVEHFFDADRLEDWLAVLKQMEGHDPERADCIFLSLIRAVAGNRKTKTEQISALRPSHTVAAPL